MARMAAACRKRRAVAVYLAATHGLFSGGAPAIAGGKKVKSSRDQFGLASSSHTRVLGDQLVVLSVASLITEAIAFAHARGLVGELLNEPSYSMLADNSRV